MRDFDFAPTGPSRSGHPQSALLLTTYKPLVPAVFITGMVGQMSLAVRTMFRNRLAEMKRVGYVPYADSDTYEFARNCPPFGVRTPIKSRCCRKTQFCPWCYAREVVSPLWNRLKALCFTAGEPREDRWVIDFCCRKLFKKKYGKPVARALELVKSRRERTSEIEWIDYEGAWIGHYIRPFEDHIVYERRGIIVTNKKVWSKPPGKIEYHVMDSITQAGLVNSIARACEYPSELMTCPAEYLTSVLIQIAEKKAKMRMCYGKLRNHHRT